jgi:dolichol kinase
VKGIRREVWRKAIHVASIAIPIFVWIFGRTPGLTLLVPALLTALAVEWARFRVRRVRYLFLRYTRLLLRTHERHHLAGATYMVIGYTLALLLFPRPIAVLAMLYNGLGDAAAALVGRRFGRHRTGWGKSWEGFGAGLVTNLALGFAIPGVPVAAALLGGITAAVLEFAPLPLDDNLKVTVGGGLAAALGTLWS